LRVASRLISHFDGMIESCDRLTGDVLGPPVTPGGPPGQMKADARLVECDRSNGNPCPDSVVDDADGQPSLQQVSSATFVMERLANPDTTCAQVRSILAPPSPYPNP
jgi:hypothetical protein